MLTLLVPILISFLLDSTTIKTSNKQTAQLHEQSLQWLMKIGPKYPAEFKMLMGQTPELRMKLESSIRNQQQNTQSSQNKLKNELTSKLNSQQQAAQQKPSIILKTNFNNFK